MVQRRKELGAEGEEQASRFLERFGYKILERNYRSPLGEIDIVATDGQVICFIEVKTRRALSYGWPQEAVHLRKQRRIVQVALIYLKEKGIRDRDIRFDVVARYGDNLELIKGAFEAGPHYYF